jgi:3-oxoadipate enol-lactonase
MAGTGDLDRGGFALHYRTEGPEGGPWVTLSNSLVCDFSMWDRIVPSLTAAGYRVLRYDQRGHGRSTPAPPPYAIGDLAGDILALWDHLGIARSSLVGLSLGGMTGIALALDHPTRVAALVAADCRASADPTYAAMFEARAETTRKEGMAPMVAPTVGLFFTPGFAAANPDTVARYGAMIAATHPDGHIGCCLALAGGRYEPRLPELSVPVLFLGGEHDIGAPPALMAAMHDRVPGSRHVVLSGVGHISCEEAPEGFVAAVLGHMARQA